MTTTTTAKRRGWGDGGIYSYSTTAGQRWRIKYSVDGERQQKRGFRTKDDARKALRAALHAADDGTWANPSRQPFGTYLDTWLDGLQLAPSTVASYKKNVRLHVKPYLGKVPLDKLTSAMLTKLYRDLEKSGRADGEPGGLSARTVRYIATIVQAALGKAVKGKQLKSNPADDAEPPSAKQAKSPEMHPWSASELSAFLGWAKDHSDLYPAWYTLATTGMRRGELLGLRWKDIELDKGTLAVRRSATLVRTKGEGFDIKEGTTKGGTSRVVNLDAATAEVLRAWRKQRGGLGLQLVQPGSLVFGSDDGSHRHPEHFSRTWSQTVYRAIRQGTDVPGIRLHDLRHTMASIWLGAGVPVKVVSERLGHSSAVVTMTIYNHVLPGMQQQAAESIAALVGAS
jgi:integrase